MTIGFIDKRIGSKLRARRNYLGITQSNLGNMLGVTFQQIQKYEKGINRVSVSKLKELSSILKVPIDYFLNDSDSVMDTLSDARLFGRLGGGDSGYRDGIDGDDIVSMKELMTLIKYFRKIENKKVRSDTLNLVRSLSAGEARSRAN
jgi:transcriptional regulator with XRE-family HTH domain